MVGANSFGFIEANCWTIECVTVVHLYAERGSPKHENAAMRWLERYLDEGSSTLQHFAEITSSLARREVQAG